MKVFETYWHNRLFNPKDDMTPVESARFAQLMATVLGPGFVKAEDFNEFIKLHNLERHFEPEEEEYLGGGEIMGGVDK